MHIVFLTENFPPERNAAASRVYERALYWVKWGHKVTIITCQPNFPEGKIYDGYKNRWYQVEMMNGLRVVRVKTYVAANKGRFRRVFDFLSFMVMGTIAGVLQGSFDVVAATSPQFFSAVAGWMVGALRRRPFIFELGDLWPESIRTVGAIRTPLLIWPIEQLELFLYRRSAKVIALTESFRTNLVARKIPAEKIDVVINGVELGRYSPRPPASLLLKSLKLEGKFVVGYLGTHGMAHGLENALLAASELQKKNSAAHFLFVGAGADRDFLIQRAQELGLTNVTFVPAQPKEIIADYWSICNVALIHLKNHDTYKGVIPSKIFEAMGMGLAILLVAPEGEGSTIVRRERAGAVVAAGKPHLLAQEVERLANSAAVVAEYAAASAKAAFRYSREKQAKDYIESLETVVEPTSLAHGQLSPR